MKKLSLIIVSILFSLSVYSQAGQKWSLSGNNITQGDFIGSTNHESLVFKTNNERRLTLKANGKIVLNTFSDSLPGLLFMDSDQRINLAEFTYNTNSVLCGDGQFRNIDNITPFTGWKLNGMDIIADQGYKVGINTFTPGALLDVNGDAIIRGTLQVYNGIIVGEDVMKAKKQLLTLLRQRIWKQTK